MFDTEGFKADPDNPNWIKCWACYTADPWHLASVFKSEEDAVSAIDRYGEQYKVAYGSHHLGTDEFIAD